MALTQTKPCMLPRTCKACGGEFFALPSHINRPNGAQFCSYKCSRKMQRRPVSHSPLIGTVIWNDKPTIVYQATNLIDGKIYIGITSQLLKRRAHQHAKGHGKNISLLSRAMQKHGPEMFRFIVLRKCGSYGEALDEERRLVGLLKPEYNLTAGGVGVIGYRLTEEQKRARGNRPSPVLGRPRPKEIMERVAAKLRGKKRVITPEYKETLAKTAALARAMKKSLGHPNSEKQRAAASAFALTKRKPVICITDEMTFISAKAADTFYGLHKGCTSNCIIKGVQTKCGKRFAWVMRGNN